MSNEALQVSLQWVRRTYGLVKPNRPEENKSSPKAARVPKSKKPPKPKRPNTDIDCNLPEERRLYTCISCQREVSLRSHGAVICQHCGSHVVAKHRLKRKVELRAI